MAGEDFKMKYLEIKQGITRIVFIFKNYVIKIPNYRYGYQYILKGLLANLQEKNLWNFHKGKTDKLCPVLYCSPFCLFLIMPKAEKVGEVEITKEVAKNYFKDYPLDYGKRNFGLYNGKIILLDYG